MIVPLWSVGNSLGDMGEFNVMVADKKDRRKGYGYYTVLLVMMWCTGCSRLRNRRQSLFEAEGLLCQDQQGQHSLHKDVREDRLPLLQLQPSLQRERVSDHHHQRAEQTLDSGTRNAHSDVACLF